MTGWGGCSGTWPTRYGISFHPRKVNSSSLSFIMPNDGKRAIVRCRDDQHIHPFPLLNIDGCRALHIDGHQPDAAIHYAKLCREAGILTSLDGGGLRTNTHRAARLHRHCDRRRAAVRADGQDARADARLSQEPRLQGRRRHHGRAWPALVRRGRRGANLAGVPDPARAR